MKTLSELIEHIKKHKDAIIIIGPEVNKFKTDYAVEDFNENYNRKNLRRSPETLWNFYNDAILTPIDNSNVYNLIQTMDYELVVNQNINSPINNKAFNIHGSVGSYICPKCKTIYTSDFVYPGEEFHNECELCGSIIRPSVLLTGERYDQAMFDNMKDKLATSHTLILIGMDYTEEPLLNLIADFGDIEAQLKAAGDPDDQKVIVAIQSKEQDFDPNEITFCDFLVKDNIEEALARMLKDY